MTRGALLLVAGLGLAASGCESNLDRSARIAAQGQQAIVASTVRIAEANPDVEVRRTAVVGADGTYAAAVQLRNRGRRAQLAVPILIDVRDGRGTSVHRNDQRGLQNALQHLASLPPGRSAWWVDDQLLGATAARRVSARVGPGRTAARAPRVDVVGARFDEDAGGRYYTGRLVNRTGVLQRDLPVFGVVLRGSRVVAAGRAIVPKLPPAAAGAKPVFFRIFFVGDARSGRVALTVAPSPRS